jgi:hypothetical protein
MAIACDLGLNILNNKIRRPATGFLLLRNKGKRLEQQFTFKHDLGPFHLL